MSDKPCSICVVGGTGPEGSGLALRWANSGHDVTIGSRDEQKAVAVAKELNSILGADLVKGGREAGDKWVSDYTAHCYHQTCDTWSADWDLRGAAQDVTLFYTIGRRLADSREWPVWNTGSEFAAIRGKTASERR